MSRHLATHLSGAAARTERMPYLEGCKGVHHACSHEKSYRWVSRDQSESLAVLSLVKYHSLVTAVPLQLALASSTPVPNSKRYRSILYRHPACTNSGPPSSSSSPPSSPSPQQSQKNPNQPREPATAHGPVQQRSIKSPCSLRTRSTTSSSPKPTTSPQSVPAPASALEPEPATSQMESQPCRNQSRLGMGARRNMAVIGRLVRVVGFGISVGVGRRGGRSF